MNEQCDRCSAKAKIRIYKETLQLYFCKHHYNKNYIKLLEDKWQEQEK